MDIAVFLGGTSAERDVSLASGFRIIDALRSAGHRVTAVDPATGVLPESVEAALRSAGMRREPPSLEELKRVASEKDGGNGAIVDGLTSLHGVRDADVVF